MDDLSFSAAEICFVDEFAAARFAVEGKSVRLVGRLISIDSVLQVGKLADPDDDEEYVLLDTSLVHAITASADGMIFALGEVCKVQEGYGLKPRLVSPLVVDDFALYRAMVLKRRSFLN